MKTIAQSPSTKILIFPAGTEVGLEIYHALEFTKNIELVGLNSTIDYSLLLYKDFRVVKLDVFSEDILAFLSNFCLQENIDIFIPAHDEILYRISTQQQLFAKTKLLVPDQKTANILRFKSLTYDAFENIIPVPRQYKKDELKQIKAKVFCKPDNGQGSRGIILCNNGRIAKNCLNNQKDLIALEYLPGDEVTVDCYTDFSGKLVNSLPRKREKIVGGITTIGKTIDSNSELNLFFNQVSEKINSNLKLKGVWFYQMKQDKCGNFKLLEIANRVSGSYSLNRARGFNGIEAYIYECKGYKINSPTIVESGVLRRSLNSSVELEINFDHVYVDYDDTVLISNQLNYKLLAQLIRWKNKQIKIILVTRHAGDLFASLKNFGLSDFFHEIIHITNSEPKSEFIKNNKSIFIDDSFKERQEISNNTGIPSFSASSAILISNSG